MFALQSLQCCSMLLKSWSITQDSWATTSLGVWMHNKPEPFLVLQKAVLGKCPSTHLLLLPSCAEAWCWCHSNTQYISMDAMNIWARGERIEIIGLHWKESQGLWKGYQCSYPGAWASTANRKFPTWQIVLSKAFPMLPSEITMLAGLGCCSEWTAYVHKCTNS